MIDLTKLVTREQKSAVANASVLTSARSLRLPIMSVLDGMQASSLSKGDTARASTIETAKQGLKDLTRLDFSGCKTPADMQGVVMTRYKQIAMALPDDIRSAFAAGLS